MNLKSLTLIAFTAAALVAAGTYVFGPQRVSQTALPALGAANAQTSEEIDTSGIIEMTLGSEDAPVTVVEYASYTCPHCKTFHETTFKELKKDYIDTGKVKFVYREVYFDRQGLWASMVARCGGPVRYFGITDMIYDQQGEWTRGEATDIVEALKKIGRSAGLTNDTLDACLKDADKAQALYALFQKNSQADNITSTPSFVINGEKHSNMSYSDFQRVLDGELEG